MMENALRLLGRHRLSKEAVRVEDLLPRPPRCKAEIDDTVIKGFDGRRRKIVAIMKLEEGTSLEEVEAEVARTVREMKTVT